MKKYEIKLVVPHSEIQLANTYLKNGYKQTWVSFEGVTLIKTNKSKKGGRK